MELIQAVIFGIVQGLTEFLPISSSAHLRILPAVMGWQDPGAGFTANIQLGTLLAVLIYFRLDLANAWKGWTAGLRDKSKRAEPDFKLGSAIAVGSIPIIILGFLFKDPIGDQLRSLNVVGGMLIVMAAVLGLAEWRGRKERGIQEVRIVDGFIVGLWQAVALIPGASRSGSTISGALFLGFDRSTAARFSFLLSVPSIFLAAVYTAYQSREELGGHLLMPLIVGNVFSFLVGYACIAFLIKFLQTNSNLAFILYRIALGATILWMVAGGRISEFAGMR